MLDSYDADNEQQQQKNVKTTTRLSGQRMELMFLCYILQSGTWAKQRFLPDDFFW